MEQRQVLSLDSVDRIRVYVKHKYKDYPQEQHAVIIADAMLKIIDRQLPPFDSSMRQQICQQLISEVIAVKKRPVQLADIIRICQQRVESDSDDAMIFEQWKVEQGLKSPEVADKLNHSNTIKLHPYMGTSSVAGSAAGSVLERSSSAYEGVDQGLAQRNATNKLKKILYYSVGSLVIIVLTLVWQQQTKVADVAEHQVTTNENSVASVLEITDLPPNELPAMYQFAEVDKDKLKGYLHTRSSLLTEAPYFEVLYNTAREFNISPVLLFAITGQEQGFVKRDHPNAEKIANNPFNVFYSWEDYNTTIEDSAAIASRTIVNLSKERPNDVEAIKWINRKYAEDPNWHKGVTSLFQAITSYIDN